MLNGNVIEPLDMNENVFRLIGKEWMLITAGSVDSFNTMTASWGGLGVLWHKDVCFCFVRPNRYTYEFLEESKLFTLSFFDERYRDALNLCGTRSGREIDKVKEAGLTPLEHSSGAICFGESRLSLVCRKIYYQDLVPEQFLDAKIKDLYPQSDYHRMYVGEIIEIRSKG